MSGVRYHTSVLEISMARENKQATYESPEYPAPPCVLVSVTSVASLQASAHDDGAYKAGILPARRPRA